MNARLMVWATVLPVATLFGQGSQPPLTFEVASIKVSAATDNQSYFETNPGRVRLVNQTLRGCIRAAYAGGGMPLKEWQVTGGPNWIDSERYDIVAKAEGRATTAQLELMLQTFLVEQFKLTVHRESQLTRGYALGVAKSGLKVKPDSAEGETPRAFPGGSSLIYERAPLTWLPRLLSDVVRAPVIDEAKVTGVYTFKIEWDSAEWQPGRAETERPPATGAVLPAPEILPSLFTALERRLGLILEPRKIPVEVVVIDRAERPSRFD